MTSVLPTLLSCHNWNTLFMGPNAVADAIAQKYNATKSQVFDHVSESRPLPGVWTWQLLTYLRPSLRWERARHLMLGTECL